MPLVEARVAVSSRTHTHPPSAVSGVVYELDSPLVPGPHAALASLGLHAPQQGRRMPAPSAGTDPGSSCMLSQIRFTRRGRNKLPFYRIIAIDSRARRDGRPLEVRALP